MARGYTIDKDIAKKITAVSSLFEVGESYTAALYNPKDWTVKITATATCVEDNYLHKIVFNFTKEQTGLLKNGYATIEIYDNNQTLMVKKPNAYIISKNSLQIIMDDESWS